mmetsp:Transcript_23646/g.40253  ORF Transcript_23646/g.40253 Transcript_23646/m.40253 type:complete len:81 (-) Transcript_23646:41-283(-)
MMTVPSSLRDIACKAVDDERPRTTRLCKKCEDRESDVVKNSDGRMVRRWQEYYLFVVMACRAMMMGGCVFSLVSLSECGI